MIEAYVIELQFFKRYIERLGDFHAHVPGNVAEPDRVELGPMTQERLGDHARGVGEVEQRGARRLRQDGVGERQGHGDRA